MKVLRTNAPAAVLLIRLMVGLVFLSDGLQKFLLPEEVGAGRFAKIGFSHPELAAGVVGGLEIGCGILTLLGLVTRGAVVPLIVIMLVAIATTKIPILQKQGFWKMAHEIRTDFSMLCGWLFLLVVGAGAWSMDARLQSHDSTAAPGGTAG